MELTKQAKLDSFLLSVEFNVGNVMNNNRSNLKCVIDKSVMKYEKGMLYFAYFGLICSQFNSIDQPKRDKLDMFLDEIDHYVEKNAEELYDEIGLEGLEKDRKKVYSIIGIKTNKQ